jgi:hypothetical protein
VGRLPDRAAGGGGGGEPGGLWDKLNIFTDSPAEAERDTWNDRARVVWPLLHRTFVAQDAALEQALRHYPPGGAFYALESVRQRVMAVRGELRRHTSSRRVGNVTHTSTTYSCELVGKSEAVTALRTWTFHAQQVFGRMPSDDALLERHWGKALDAPPPAPAP